MEESTIAMKPDHQIFYPVGNDDKGGCLMLFGQSNADKLAILCAGFPDDHTCMIPFANRLATETNCLAGVICLPGFDDRPDKPWQSHPVDGYSYNDWVDAVQEAVKALKEYSSSSSSTNSSTTEKKLTGIFHDWGVLAGLMYTNRALENAHGSDKMDSLTTVDSSSTTTTTSSSSWMMIHQLILVDVLIPFHPKTCGMELIVAPKKSFFKSIYDSITTISYRLVLANSFFYQRYISKYLGVWNVKLGFTILGMIGITPFRKVDTMLVENYPLDLYRFTYMAYPYYRLFLTIWTGSIRTQLHGAHPPIDMRKTPVLYLYGKDKNIMFHEDKQVLYLENENKLGRKSNAIALDKSGHWPYITQADECMKSIKEFMAD